MELEFHQLELSYSGLRIEDKRRQSRLASSLLECGQQSPVLVVKSGDGYVLIDGYRRVSALRELGRDTVVALVLEQGETDALVLSHQLSVSQRRNALEDGWLILELHEQHGLSLDVLSLKLGRSKSWVSRRLGLVVGLPVRVQELVREGAICPQAAMKYFLPLARANGKECERLAEGIREAHLSVRQVKQLYVAWRMGDAAQRRRLLEDPLLYLKALESVQAPEPLAEPEERALVDDLEAVAGVCRRARRRVRSLSRRPEGLVLWESFRRSWQEARVSFESLTRLVKEASRAGSGDTRRDLAAPRGGARSASNREDAAGIAQLGEAGAEEQQPRCGAAGPRGDASAAPG